MSKPGVLLTGSTGQVGSYLLDLLPAFANVTAPRRAELDLCNAASIRAAVRQAKPAWIIHPAAYTAVDKAESDRETCYQVNTEATRVLADEAQKIGAALITFSTDYVFDGSGENAFVETDATSPLNVYGASKLKAEQLLAQSGCDYVNLRTSWVYSARGQNFVKTILQRAGERECLSVVNDQFGSPSYAGDLAQAVLAVLHKTESTPQEISGTYHLAGSGITTWFGLATAVVQRARELQPEKQWARVEPVPSTSFPTPARRPQNSRLDCAKFQQIFGFHMPRWEVSTGKVVEQLLTPE